MSTIVIVWNLLRGVLKKRSLFAPPSAPTAVSRRGVQPWNSQAWEFKLVYTFGAPILDCHIQHQPAGPQDRPQAFLETRILLTDPLLCLNHTQSSRPCSDYHDPSCLLGDGWHHIAGTRPSSSHVSTGSKGCPSSRRATAHGGWCKIQDNTLRALLAKVMQPFTYDDILQITCGERSCEALQITC